MAEAQRLSGLADALRLAQVIAQTRLYVQYCEALAYGENVPPYLASVCPSFHDLKLLADAASVHPCLKNSS